MSAIAPQPGAGANPPWVPPKQGDWTVADYMRLENPPGFRYELIEGDLLISPSPSFWHQSAVMILSELMSVHIRKNKLGVVLPYLFDVNLIDGDETAVQPDLLFVRQDRRSIIKNNHIEGAPDLVVEAISPKREAVDREKKFRKYAEAGVGEYWILDPVAETIEVWVRRGESLVQTGRFGTGMQSPSEVIAGFSVPVDEVFGE
jgi:Uma2 family endonuclease